MTEVSPMPEAKPKSPLSGNYEEYPPRPNSVSPSSSAGTGTLLPSDVQGENPPNVPPRENNNGDQSSEEKQESEQAKRGDDKSIELPKDRYKLPPDGKHGSESQALVQEQKLVSNGAMPPRPIQPNSYRSPLDPTYRPPLTATSQMRPPNHIGPVMPSQIARKPDGSPAYGQTYQNPQRPTNPYLPSNTGYSTSSYQPVPPPPTYSSSQIRGDVIRTNLYPNSSPMGQTAGQRSYAPTQPYLPTSGPPRPQLNQPVINRPQIYPTAPQRIMPDNYQKTPNVSPALSVRPGYATAPGMSTPASQYYKSAISNPLTPTSMPSTLGDSALRIYKTDANLVDPSKSKPQIPLANTASVPIIPTADPRTLRQTLAEPGASNQKKPEGEERKTVPDADVIKLEAVKTDKPNVQTEGRAEEPRKEKEKEPGIVLTNVKFFEERDKAKVPLTPQIPSPVKPVPVSRSATFVSNNVVKGEIYKNEEYESGVDESPLLLRNLRSILPERPLELYSRSGRPREQHKRKHKNDVNSYPSTPIKFSPNTIKFESPWKTSKSSSKSCRSIFEFSPEEELLYFFNIAKASYRSCYDRTQDHISRIDEASHRKISGSKENMPTANGDIHGVKKTPTRLPAPSKRSSSACSPTKTPLRSPSVPKSLPKTPDSPAPPAPLIKKVPMNKIQVGAAPSPNLKAVKSKIGSLANTTHKPGGGNIKIESHKIDFSKTQPRIAAKNETYAPGGGDKKIQQVKLQWSAKPKVGSLENAAHRPGGGDKKIETVKLDFKDKAKAKVGSKDNVKHVPGGGAVKNSTYPPEWKSMDIESQKLEFKAQSKVGSLDNVKHKPGGGDVKIFDDKTYLKQISCNSSEGRASGTQSYCDLSVVSEVHSVSAPGTPHHGTAIKIKKSTTLGKTKPEMRKTTEVTVISRSPSIERKGLITSPSTHEVKLTYAKVASSKSADNVGPVEVVNVPARENAAILKPDDTTVEVRNLISSFEQQITSNKGPMFGREGKKTKPEPAEPPRQASEELNQRFAPVKDELTLMMEESKSGETEDESEDTPAAKFLKNEMAAHEKVGEIWKEVHNIDPDKPNKQDEGAPPPPPPTPSVAQKPGFQQPPQQQFAGVRQRPPFPQQHGPRLPGQGPQQPLPRPLMQRPSFPQGTPQMRPIGVSGPGLQPQRQPYPELASGPFPVKPTTFPQREPSDTHMAPPSLAQQPSSPVSPRVNFSAPPQK